MMIIIIGDGDAVELSDIDLNLLVVLDLLMRERRVSKVAQVLGLTQPAVSNALAKLRRHFGDDLFVRTPAGMLPTPFAEQLAEPIGAALAMIHGGLNQQTRFEPATAQGVVTIGMTDIGEIVFLPALIDRLRREAPGLSVQTVRTTAVNLGEDMQAGKVDLAVGLLPQLKAGFFQRRLFGQRYVCLFRRGHALASGRLTLAEFGSAEHLIIVASGTGHGQVDELIRKAGIERNIRVTVPHFVGVGHLLQRTDLVATVTEKLAERLAEPFGLAYRAHPVRLPEVPINLFWHAKVHRAPANRWLRSVVVELFGTASPRGQAPS